MTSNRAEHTTVEVPDKPGHFMKVGPWIEFFKKYIANNRGDEFTDQTINYYNARIASKKHFHEDETFLRMTKQLCDMVGSKLIMVEVVDRKEVKEAPGITPKDIDWIEIGEKYGAIFELNDHDFMMRYTRYKEKELPVEELNKFARDAYHSGADYNEWVASQAHAIIEKNL